MGQRLYGPDSDRTASKRLEKLVATRNYDEAEKLCRAALSEAGNPLYWETQLGYILFLNKGDTEKYYFQTPEVFESLVDRYPNDRNAHFWLGYIYYIVQHDEQKSRNEMEAVLQINSNHPYANLFLAGIVQQEASIPILQRVLQQQPNIRALRQLAQVYTMLDESAKAQATLRRLIETKPYVEKNYGIMNEYMNDVLTGATHEQKWRSEAQAQLNQSIP